MPAGATAPTIMIWAMKDPESGNLDRIQVVKGYYKDGYPRDTVYDVAWSDGRQPDPNSGKLPPVGNFDPSQHAVYYVRVIEIPTPRWSTYDARERGVEPLDDVPATIQERAWSSPFWYTPDPSLVKRLDYYPGLTKHLP